MIYHDETVDGLFLSSFQSDNKSKKKSPSEIILY